ncbi:hypothetical protein [Chryseobacterium mucoviscidosis]
MKKLDQDQMANVSGGLKCIYEGVLAWFNLSGYTAFYNCVIKNKDNGYN